jgi:hypothetical protein
LEEMEGSLRHSISSVAEKIQEIVDTAERVARDIRADAEADAARYRADRQREADALMADRAARLRELSTSLSEHADRVRAEVVSLSAELSRAADELGGQGHEATGGAPAEPIAYPGTARTELTNGGDAGFPEEALLRATQMSIAGSSRAEIESALRDEFELDDPAVVTAQALGQARASLRRPERLRDPASADRPARTD